MNQSDQTKRDGDKDVAQRRDEVLRRMINTPPKPHKPLGKPPAKKRKPKKAPAK